MKLAYAAFDKSGKAASGTLEANSPADAKETLRRQGMFVTDIAAIDGDSSSSSPLKKSGGRIGSGQRLKNLAMFSRQLHVLISSGTPIVQAISAIERQCEHPLWQHVVADIRAKVEEGSPLSEAMRQHPKYFDAVCRSIVHAGETSGNLPQMLDRLASLTRKQLHLRTMLIGAMVYPCLLIVMGVTVLIVMLMFVLPRFSGLFANLDTPLPPTTKMLMWLSGMLWSWWWAILILVVGGGFGIKSWIGSESGKRTFHRMALNLPKFGRLTRSLMTAKMSRMLGTLLESQVALLDALELTRLSAGNVQYADLIAKAEDAVGRGEPMSAILCDSDLVSACVQETIRNGEHSGQIGKPLLHMADFLDEENDVVVKSLTSMIEPAILIGLGVMVGFIALSMFLPLFDLVSAAHGGG